MEDTETIELTANISEELIENVCEYEEYDDPFASEREDSICTESAEIESEIAVDEGEIESEITVYVPMVSNEPVILSFQTSSFPLTRANLLEKMREEVPAAFNSENEFIGRVYCGGNELVELEDEIGADEVVVLVNDLMRGKGNEEAETEKEDEGESSESAETSEPIETRRPIETSQTSEASVSSEPSQQLSVSSTLTSSSTNVKQPKSLMSRFKNLWTSDKDKTAKPIETVNIKQDTTAFVSPSLESLQRNDETGMPFFIEDVLEYLGESSQIQEGIFRLSGTFSRIQSLQDRLNSGERLKAMSLLPSDCHNVASLLKQFLRNLPEPLLTFELYDAWQSLGGWTESQEVSCKIARYLVSILPPLNKKVLVGLMDFLHARLKDSDVTRMNACNYGTVIGPNLLWHRGEDRQTRNSTTLGLSLQSTTLASQICTLFLLNYKEIFECSGCCGVLAHGRVLYDYTGEDELSLKEDQIVFITGIEDTFDGWWRGFISFNGNEEGDFEQKFPSNYVKVEAQLADNEIIKYYRAS